MPFGFLRKIGRRIDRAIRPYYKTAAAAVVTQYGGPLGSVLGGVVRSRGGGGVMPGGSRPRTGGGMLPVRKPWQPTGNGGWTDYDPSFGGTMTPTMGSVPPAIVGGVRVLGRGAQTLFRSADQYCRRHPAWCAAIGGVPAVAQMVAGGQLPPIKRRRRKGISATDLQKFRRVASFLSKWGPVASKLPCKPRTGRKC